MKIALAQIDTTVGDLRGNSEKILSALDEACRRGASLVVFPEQTLGGYPALDLWEEPGFAAANERALAALAKKVRGTAALIGFVSRCKSAVGKPVRNSAALLHNGKVVAIRHKTLLPTYDVFDEARYFEPAAGNKPISWGGLKLGVSICEDAWARDPSSKRRLYAADPVDAQAKAGADILLNLSASPFLRGKTEVRKKLIAEHSKRLKKPVFYCNAVGGNDEIVFDGGSLAFDAKGKLRARGAFAAQDLLVFDTNTWEGAEIAPEPTSVGQVGEILTLGIKDFAAKCGLQTAFIGLSGGIDSAVAATLAARALGPHRVVGVTMPSAYSSRGSLEDAKLLAQNLGIELRSAPIAGVYGALIQTLGTNWGKGTPDLAEQNLQARARGVILMSLANKIHRGFVLTTGNKSELAVGYCTLYGDMCGALAPLADAPKRLVYELAGWLNEGRSIIPRNSITKEPSAELKPGQKDQDDLPPYNQVDDALEAWVQTRLEPGRVAQAVGNRAVAETLLDRMDSSEFKRRQAPPSIKISSKAFGVGRRMPIAKAGWRVRAGL
ncbi:MAG: NAD+ synthase [Elusimicrobia bacterium CG11_big_fil_rev_8_21_14_0_20_64_6]|nr:MAG: NAD+ synthase [Elusimicrobia bacterium CG11_big_fil_rev_8_21_14_0_20_64_6]